MIRGSAAPDPASCLLKINGSHVVKRMKTNKPSLLWHGWAPFTVLSGRASKLFKVAVAALLVQLLMTTNALALDRWTALAMVESGGNDRAVGRVGEISRYQIRPELWAGGNPLDADTALANAQHIMAVRMALFQQSHRRLPDDFEFYILWNAPGQLAHPHRVVTERARRFVNLVNSGDPATSIVATR